MKLSTLLLMMAYVAASFIIVPYLTYIVAVNTATYLGATVAASLAALTAAVSVATLMYLGSNISIETENRPL